MCWLSSCLCVNTCCCPAQEDLGQGFRGCLHRSSRGSQVLDRELVGGTMEALMSHPGKDSLGRFASTSLSWTPSPRGPQKREQEVGCSRIPLAWAMPLGLGALSEQRWGCLKAVSRSPSRFWFWKLECSQRCRGWGVVPCSHHQKSSHPAVEGILAAAKGSEEGSR